MFQHLFFYLEYHEKQLIIDLQDKIKLITSSQVSEFRSSTQLKKYQVKLKFF